jgi:hypothetical protein
MFRWKRFPLAACLAAFACCWCLTWRTGSLAAAKSDDVPHVELATFPFSRGTIGGTGSLFWTTGFTVATLENETKETTRLLISAAFACGDTQSRGLRVLAITKHGRRLAAKNVSSASASGNRHEIISMICDFEAPAASIEKLVIQHKVAEAN